MENSGTGTTTTIRTTTGTSASGTGGGTAGGDQTPFTLTSLSDSKPIAINENIYFENPQMIASGKNETNKMSGNKSFQLSMTLSSNNSNLSPILDTQRMGVFAIQNRLNSIGSATDLYSANVNSADTVI